MKALALSLCALAVVTSPRVAWSQVADEVPPPAPPVAPSVDTRQTFTKLGLGLRTTFLTDETVDRFMGADAMPTFSLSGTRTLIARDRYSFAAGLAYDVGARKSNVSIRGLDGTLAAHRFTVPFEGRFHALPMLYGALRLAPGFQHTIVAVQDPSASSGELGKNGQVFAFDASLAASVLLGPHKKPDKRVVRVWLTPEVGYMFSSKLNLDLTPANRDDPRRVEPTRFGALAMNGPYFRVMLDFSF